MSRSPKCALPFLATLFLPMALDGQDRRPDADLSQPVRVFGEVVDRSTGAPLPQARISIARVGFEGDEPFWVGSSNASGRFQTVQLPRGVFLIRVEMLSYSALSHLTVFPDEGEIDFRAEMVPVDFALPPVVVTATRDSRLSRSGFFERATAGTGQFVTRSEILALAPLEMSDIFRQMAGVRVTPSRLGTGASVRLRGDCEPQVVLDGTPMASPVPIDVVTSPSDIEAIEVYHGATSPIQYTSMSTCGTIMMWTRDTGTPEMNGTSLKKFMAAVGFIFFAVVSTN